MIKLEITEEQARIIYKSLKLFIDEIDDDPSLAGINEDECRNEWEVDCKLFEFINMNINPIVDEINKQIK